MQTPLTRLLIFAMLPSIAKIKSRVRPSSPIHRLWASVKKGREEKPKPKTPQHRYIPMPNYKPIHLTAKAVQRSKGHNIIAKVAYRACERIKDEHTGKTHDYREKGKTSALGGWGVLATKILTQDGINTISRFDLWTAVNKSEKRKDACTGREYEFTMPEELQTGLLEKDYKTFQKLCDELAEYIISEHGNAVDYAIHPPNKKGDVRNIHCHMMTTTRQFKENSFGEKVDFEKQGQGAKKKKSLENIRQKYTDICNKYIKKRYPDIEIEYTKESYKNLGIDKVATVHLGYVATEMERSGKRSFLGDINRQIRHENQLKQEIILANEHATNHIIEKSGSRIAERKRAFDETEFSVKYIADRTVLNAREREARLSLADTNERAIIDTDRFIENTNYEIQSADSTYRILKHQLNERLEQEKLAQLERERQQRERDLSVARLAKSLPLTKHEQGYDFEHSNIVFDEFLKLYEPLSDEQFKYRSSIGGKDGKRLSRAISVYDNGLMSISHYEKNFRGDINIKKKFFEISEIARFDEFNSKLEFKNLGGSLAVEPNIAHWVKSSMRASEQFKHQPPQPPAPKPNTLEQPKAEPTHHTPKPRF